MTRINLLPWREAKRQEQKKQFLTLLGMVALCMLGISYGIALFIDQLVANQNQRNAYLEGQITALEQQISRISEIKKSKQEIEQRMALIEQLQSSRNVAPRVIDELARIVPPGVVFKRLGRQERVLEVSGTSESNNRLSEFMRRLQESEVFINPELSSIVADVEALNPVSDFNIKFRLSPMIAPEFSDTKEEPAP